MVEETDRDELNINMLRSTSQDKEDTNALRKILSFTAVSMKYVFRGESECDQ